jgi:hypothetical protein
VQPDSYAAYLAAAQSATSLLATPVVGDRWHDPSVLDGMTVGTLAGHLARSVLQVEWYLDDAQPDPPSIDAPQYYADLEGTRDPASALNVGVRERSEQTAAGGHQVLVGDVQACLGRLQQRIPQEPDQRRVSALGRSITLAEYLRTRCVELAVHSEDLALSLEVPPPPVDEAAEVAVQLLVGAAVRRHGAAAVLRSLTRTERDPDDLVRVL